MSPPPPSLAEAVPSTETPSFQVTLGCVKLSTKANQNSKPFPKVLNPQSKYLGGSLLPVPFSSSEHSCCLMLPRGHLKSACSPAIPLTLVKPWDCVREVITFIPVTVSGSFPPQIYLEAAPFRSRQTSCLEHQGPHSRPLPSGNVPASYSQMVSLATFFFF